MADPQQTHPAALRLQVIVQRLSETIRMAERATLVQEAMVLLEQLAAKETQLYQLERDLIGLRAERDQAEKRAAADRHRAELMEHGLNESIAHLDASSARIREARARVSGHRHEPPPYRG